MATLHIGGKDANQHRMAEDQSISASFNLDTASNFRMSCSIGRKLNWGSLFARTFRTFGDDESDVVVLLVGAELPDFLNNCGKQG